MCSSDLRDRNKFVSLKEKKDGTVSFGNDGPSNVIGSGTVTLRSKDVIAKNVLLVENMNHNLLSVGQMCDQDTQYYSTPQNVKSGKAGMVKLWLQQVELQTTYMF